jgi:hypothetical protein
MPIDPGDLVERIQAAKPTWLARAQKEAAADETAGAHVSKSGIWSEVKPILLDHQRAKCAYCERRLGTEPIEWDVEHFRPKKRVDSWKSPSGVVGRSGGSDPRGYFLLAFEPHNYLVACKPCNSNYKSNYFPVARRRVLDTRDLAALRRERPYLLNPLDPEESPPEEVIGFHGLNPRPVMPDEASRRRAVVTIEVLGLLERQDLNYGRAQVIRDLWIALEAADTGDPVVLEAIETSTGPGGAFANCARSFRALYERDRESAREIAVLASDFVRSHSG